jgi:hypothetical protein
MINPDLCARAEKGSIDSSGLIVFDLPRLSQSQRYHHRRSKKQIAQLQRQKTQIAQPQRWKKHIAQPQR